jgi:hypothetical protein
MKFVIYQLEKDPEYFIVTDDAHKEKVRTSLITDSGLKEIGNFEEMGKMRAAFDEDVARNAIEKLGYLKVHAEGMADMPVAPEMPA